MASVRLPFQSSEVAGSCRSLQGAACCRQSMSTLAPCALPSTLASIESYLCHELSVNCSAFQGHVVRKVCRLCDFGTIPEPAKIAAYFKRDHACFTCFTCPRRKPFLAKRPPFGATRSARSLQHVNHVVHTFSTDRDAALLSKILVIRQQICYHRGRKSQGESGVSCHSPRPPQHAWSASTRYEYTGVAQGSQRPSGGISLRMA